MDRLIATLVGCGLIIFIYWFFFSKPDDVEGPSQGKIKIKVNGGYKPGVIKVNRGNNITFELTRTDKNPCLEEIVIPDFGIKEYLPLNSPVNISITFKHKGEYDIHCGMNMFHGKIIVV